MPDKKLTDEEIKKALECCMDEMGCIKGCPCFNPKAKGSHCTAAKKLELEKLTLDLINRLQAENERLLKFEKIAGATIERQEAEIERLKSHIQEGIDLAKQIPEMIELAKAEAYKEFAERLKREKATGMNWFGKEHYSVNIEEIDNLLKELVGENDEMPSKE